VNPEAYLTDTLSQIAAGHPINRISELMPWAYQGPRPGTRGRDYHCPGRMWTSHTRRRPSSRLLMVKVPGECLTFLIVRKIHGKDDYLLVLIVFKFRRLATVAIEPFAHGG
jgi:hypothetical protein